jgi:hypothetical protein
MARGQSDAVLRPLRVLLETGSVAGITDGEKDLRSFPRSAWECRP